MPILLNRVDDRLIHGQVVVGWAQELKANHIIVVNDETVKNDMQKFLFRMATPTEIELSILTVDEAAQKVKKREYEEDRAIMLFKSPGDALRMVMAGAMIGELNIGGMHFEDGKIQLFDAIFVNADDVDALTKLGGLKVALEVRMVPTDIRRNILKAIEEKIKKQS
ncbi:MAG: PTS sugar transporter subunit IIB [Spirochaetia bacterium]|nr:PTS sugar transporter subunit IIB [Spirochaetia bacterium]